MINCYIKNLNILVLDTLKKPMSINNKKNPISRKKKKASLLSTCGMLGWVHHACHKLSRGYRFPVKLIL